MPRPVSCSAGNIEGIIRVVTLHTILGIHQNFHKILFRQEFQCANRNTAFINHCKSEDGSVTTNDHHSLRLLLFTISHLCAAQCTSTKNSAQYYKTNFSSDFSSWAWDYAQHTRVCSCLCHCCSCHFLPSLMSQPHRFCAFIHQWWCNMMSTIDSSTFKLPCGLYSIYHAIISHIGEATTTAQYNLPPKLLELCFLFWYRTLKENLKEEYTCQNYIEKAGDI